MLVGQTIPVLVGQGVFVGSTVSVGVGGLVDVIVGTDNGVSVGIIASAAGMTGALGAANVVEIAVGVNESVALGIAVGVSMLAKMPEMAGKERGTCKKASTGSAFPGQNAQTAVIQTATRKRARNDQRTLARDLAECRLAEAAERASSGGGVFWACG